MSKAADMVGVAATVGWTWEWWLVFGLVAIFASMLAAAVAAQVCNSRKMCFRSNPDPIAMGHLGCHGCDDAGDCLR